MYNLLFLLLFYENIIIYYTILNKIITYMEAILSKSTRKWLWFEITKMQTAV